MTDFNYEPSNLDHVEDLEKYEPGGYHPVHLNDKFDPVDNNYRYEVLHKLGHGGFSTVWLAHDLIDGGYVALKIVRASETSYGLLPAVASILDAHPSKVFATELRRFFITGPNGRHLCQVLPLTGPSLLALSTAPYRLHPAACKSLARQAAQALVYLHDRGLCHGDFTPANLTLTLSPSLHSLPPTTLLTLLGGAPTTDKVYTTTGDSSPSAPRYVVEPAALTHLPAEYLLPTLRILDFDQLFPSPINPAVITADTVGSTAAATTNALDDSTAPPTGPLASTAPPTDPTVGSVFRELGTPIAYLSPEALISHTPGPASDVWALACTLFRMRSGTQLVNEWHFGMAVNVLLEIFDQIIGGDLPEGWKRVACKGGWPVVVGDGGREEEGEEVEMVEFEGGEGGLEGRVKGIWDQGPEVEGGSEIFWRAQEGMAHHWGNVQGGFPQISEGEAVQFADLLRRMMEYDVDKRITAKEVLEHPWLKE